MDQFIGEIRIFPGNFVPAGWAACAGQLLLVRQNSTLFAVIGTTYGGDGSTDFRLPDLRDRFPMGHGTGLGLSPYDAGETVGQATVTLNSQQMPSHGHALQVVATGNATSPAGRMLAVPRSGRAATKGFATPGAPGTTSLQLATLAPSGDGWAHNNMPPFLAMTFAIALDGEFPPRS
ncbi:phage tail protein [Kitasatospora indigofera]|uniref:phage tail protein n=1 Tax=Kitasatospora indigofera TaxID=67307 RepID=UPI0036A3FA96